MSDSPKRKNARLVDIAAAMVVGGEGGDGVAAEQEEVVNLDGGENVEEEVGRRKSRHS